MSHAVSAVSHYNTNRMHLPAVNEPVIFRLLFYNMTAASYEAAPHFFKKRRRTLWYHKKSQSAIHRDFI